MIYKENNLFENECWLGTRWRNRLGRQVLKPGVLGSIPTEDEPLTTTRKHYLIPEKNNPNSLKNGNTRPVEYAKRFWNSGDSGIEKIEVKLTHLKQKKNECWLKFLVLWTKEITNTRWSLQQISQRRGGHTWQWRRELAFKYERKRS